MKLRHVSAAQRALYAEVERYRRARNARLAELGGAQALALLTPTHFGTAIGVPRELFAAAYLGRVL